jgi:hypothetical protein
MKIDGAAGGLTIGPSSAAWGERRAATQTQRG